MEKLRIHKMKYRNRGMANKKLKGLNEFHVIFKFNTDEQAKGFITKVKDWYYSKENARPLPEDVKKRINDGLVKKAKQRNDETKVKKPVPAKRKPGRPPKKIVQG